MSTKYITTAAGIAVGMVAGNAAAAPTLTSKAPAGYTALTFDGSQMGTLGSFDTSGAGLNTITVGGYFLSDAPKVSFSSAQGSLIAAETKDVGTSGGTATFADAYTTLPSAFAGSSANGNYAVVTKDGTSNFSSTPLFGETQFTDASGGTSNGYFEGTASGNTFTLLDYGLVGPDVATSAVPEPDEWALLATGVAGIGAVLRRRRKSAAAGMTAATA